MKKDLRHFLSNYNVPKVRAGVIVLPHIERRKVMAAEFMKKLPFTLFAMEMRSGKIIEIDDGFVKMLGYTEEDMNNGLVFKDIVPDIDYESIISELRETFIDQRYACYEHFFKTKTGEKIRVVVFIRIENKLLEGHRVLRVSVGNVSSLN